MLDRKGKFPTFYLPTWSELSCPDRPSRTPQACDARLTASGHILFLVVVVRVWTCGDKLQVRQILSVYNWFLHALNLKRLLQSAYGRNQLFFLEPFDSLETICRKKITSSTFTISPPTGCIRGSKGVRGGRGGQAVTFRLCN